MKPLQHFHLLLILLIYSGLVAFSGCTAQTPAENKQQDATSTANSGATSRVQLGAEQLIALHADKLKGKRVGIVAHRASVVFDSVHTVDALAKAGIKLTRIFAPEHGFRGQAEAGAHIQNGKDAATGLPVVSLYGKNKKPTAQQLAELDVVLFDLQDVGARFYTYLSTLTYVLEACAEQGIPLWILDRPNPNGQYVGGPTLKMPFQSFVGMHAIPVVHGMTLGEMARLLRAQHSNPKMRACSLQVIRMEGYRHSMRWVDTGLRWVPPSPNLPNSFSAEIYPLICWFEGTDVSVGRGTDSPFEQVGAPWHRGLHRQYLEDRETRTLTNLTRDSLTGKAVAFVPRSIAGVATGPPHEADSCYGLRITALPSAGPQRFRAAGALLQNFHNEYLEAQKLGTVHQRAFFDAATFDGLAGSKELRQALLAGQSLEALFKVWERDAAAFEEKRGVYRMYGE